MGFLARLQLGLLFGWLYWRTRSLGAAIGAHAGNNLISSAAFLVGRGSAGADEDPSASAVLMLAALGGLALAGLLRLGRAQLLGLPAPAGGPSENAGSAPGHDGDDEAHQREHQ